MRGNIFCPEIQGVDFEGRGRLYTGYITLTLEISRATNNKGQKDIVKLVPHYGPTSFPGPFPRPQTRDKALGTRLITAKVHENRPQISP